MPQSCVALVVIVDGCWKASPELELPLHKLSRWYGDTELQLLLANPRRRLRATRHRWAQGSAQAPGLRLHHGVSFPRPRTTMSLSRCFSVLTREFVDHRDRPAGNCSMPCPCLRRSTQQSDDPVAQLVSVASAADDAIGDGPPLPGQLSLESHRAIVGCSGTAQALEQPELKSLRPRVCSRRSLPISFPSHPIPSHYLLTLPALTLAYSLRAHLS